MEKTAENKVTVVDLDGTLLRVNSLSLFVRFLAARLLARRDIIPLCRLLWTVCLRKLRLSSHAAAKWKAMHIADRHLTQTDYHDFIAGLEPHVRRELCPDGSGLWILATAAPAQYALIIAENLRFDECVATPMSATPENYTETRSEEKLRRVLPLLPDSPAIRFFTDHQDDTPLMDYTRDMNGEVTLIR